MSIAAQDPTPAPVPGAPPTPDPVPDPPGTGAPDPSEAPPPRASRLASQRPANVRRAAVALVAGGLAVAGLACSGSRDLPGQGEGRDPIVSQTTTASGRPRGQVGTDPQGTGGTGGSGDLRTTTTGNARVPPGAPTGPSGASGMNEGGTRTGSTVQGAEPGQDIDDLSPPGGTYPVPDPGGDGSGESDPPRRTSSG